MLLLKRVVLCFGIAVLVAWKGQAQSPLGPEFRVNTGVGVEIEADIKAGSDGVFTVSWLDYVDVNTGPEYIAVRRFASSGRELRELRLLEFSVNESVSEQRLAPTQ